MGELKIENRKLQIENCKLGIPTSRMAIPSSSSPEFQFGNISNLKFANFNFQFPILNPRSSILDPQSSILNLQSSIFNPAHSYLSAIIGSTRSARRAGMKLAAKATPVSSSAIATKVTGSVALTPYNRLVITRVTINAANNPIRTPANVSINPWPATSFSTSPALAPSAIRIPIS